jgi:hypothetical protein
MTEEIKIGDLVNIALPTHTVQLCDILDFKFDSYSRLGVVLRKGTSSLSIMSENINTSDTSYYIVMSEGIERKVFHTQIVEKLGEAKCLE